MSACSYGPLCRGSKMAAFSDGKEMDGTCLVTKDGFTTTEFPFASFVVNSTACFCLMVFLGTFGENLVHKIFLTRAFLAASLLFSVMPWFFAGQPLPFFSHKYNVPSGARSGPLLLNMSNQNWLGSLFTKSVLCFESTSPKWPILNGVPQTIQ